MATTAMTAAPLHATAPAPLEHPQNNSSGGGTNSNPAIDAQSAVPSGQGQPCPPHGAKAICGRRPRMEDAYTAVPFLLEVPLRRGAGLGDGELLPPRVAAHVRSGSAPGSPASGGGGDGNGEGSSGGSGSRGSGGDDDDGREKQRGQATAAEAAAAAAPAASPSGPEANGNDGGKGFNADVHMETLHFFGVFDGHGGAEAALHCARTLHRRIAEALTEAAGAGTGGGGAGAAVPVGETSGDAAATAAASLAAAAEEAAAEAAGRDGGGGEEGEEAHGAPSTIPSSSAPASVVAAAPSPSSSAARAALGPAAAIGAAVGAHGRHLLPLSAATGKAAGSGDLAAAAAAAAASIDPDDAESDAESAVLFDELSRGGSGVTPRGGRPSTRRTLAAAAAANAPAAKGGEQGEGGGAEEEEEAEETAPQRGAAGCSAESIESALTNAFTRTDAEFAAADGDASLVGTTAVVALVGSRRLYVANCGDSRAVLCRGGAALPLTDDHKAAREDETARVEAAGGQILFWNGVRVMGVLAVSRAIGDHCLRPFVIARPEVTILQRRPDDELLLLASDGLWDVLSNAEAVTLARRCVARARERGATRAAAARIAATVLTRAAVDRGSRDNVTVVVVDLSEHGLVGAETISNPSASSKDAAAAAAAEGGSKGSGCNEGKAGAEGAATASAASAAAAAPASEGATTRDSDGDAAAATPEAAPDAAQGS